MTELLHDCEFKRIKLRTKIGSTVYIEEINPQEIMLSNYDKALAVRDVDNNLLFFLHVNDNSISTSNTWSATQIVKYITDNLPLLIDGIDCGTF